MSKLIPTNRHNPCPVCGDTRGRCRHKSTPEGDFTLCMTNSGARKFELIDGYKCISHARGGQWAIFVRIQDVISFNSKITTQRRQERELQAQREKAEKAKGALPAVGRDYQIRRLHRHFGLSQKHRKNLRGRGLTDEQIDQRLFFTITPNELVPPGVSGRLPGIHNQRIKAAGVGFACVTFDEQGRATGWQIRLDEASDNRYRWAKSPHLLNGELPITYCVPDKVESKAIGVAEGILKPWIAANRHNQVFLGAASANFATSPEQTNILLETASQRLGGSKLIEFYADAGAISNRHVKSSYQRSWELFQNLGYEVKVVWWGQIDKSYPDCDEISSEALQKNKKLLKPDEFVELTEKEALRLAVIAAQKPLRELTREPAFKTDETSRYLPDLTKILPESGLIGIKAPKGSGKSWQIKMLINLAKAEGIPVLSITPRIALGREQAFKWEITWTDDSGVTKNKGVDTCQQLEQLESKIRQVSEELKELNRPIQYDFFGNDAIEQRERRKQDLEVEIERLQEAENNVVKASFNTLALCWDSLWKTKDRDMRRGLIIIDEAELGFAHVATSSTCKDRRAFVLKILTEKIRECLGSGGRVILSDADLTDIGFDYINSLLPKPVEPFIVSHQYYAPETTCLVDFRTGARGDTSSAIINDLRNGAHLVVATDSQAEAEALEILVREELPQVKTLRIDSKTTEKNEGKALVTKINESILTIKPQLLIYTPSLGVGASIDESTTRIKESEDRTDLGYSDWAEIGEEVPYFDAVYGLFFGALEPSQARQMLARVRANVPRIVWCKEKNEGIPGCKSPFPETVKRQLLKYHDNSFHILELAKAMAGYDAGDEEIREMMFQLLQEAWDPNSKTWNNPHLDLYCKLKARRNYGLQNLAPLLKEELEAEGHEVFVRGGDKSDDGERISEIKEELKIAKSVAISQAEDISIEEAREVGKKVNATEDERNAASKAFLSEELPGVELAPEFIYKAVVSDRRRWLNAVKRHWHVEHPKATKMLDEDTWLHSTRSFAKAGLSYVPDVKTHTTKVKAIQESGILDFVRLDEPSKKYCHDSPEAEEFKERVLKCAGLIKTAFDINVTTNAQPIKLANRLLEKLGLRLKKEKRKGVREYSLDIALLDDKDRLSVIAAMDRKWELLQEKKAECSTANADVATVENGQKSARVSEGNQSPKTQSEKAIESTATYPPIVNNTGVSGSNQISAFQASGSSSSALQDVTFISDSENQPCSTPIADVDTAENGQKSAIVSEVNSSPTTQSETAIESTATYPPIVNNTGVSGSNQISAFQASESSSSALQDVTSISDLEIAIEAFSICESREDFLATASGFTWQVIDDAICLQDDQPSRMRLRAWLDEVVPTGEPIPFALDTLSPWWENYHERQEVVFYHPHAEGGWIKGIVDAVCHGFLKVSSGLFGMLVEKPHLIAPT
ncbi:MAG: hypothetical protein F6K58_22505 [Symploca sp. SIO2E9]|nr:hypothetical protein [Symploca sp. SIO2E9]